MAKQKSSLFFHINQWLQCCCQNTSGEFIPAACHFKTKNNYICFNVKQQ